ncbi:calcium/proton exchanger [Pullulanibacillus sp. KACC 23026]|uniref:calcium/proton exchanger n=1 Tax=Pullulanibacillus sp. KACC 23026 TaxID=3028315 RepID=UPI0023AEE33E|nr:calcium/proton exchanger [Pullulanibacillus sp. KACC 23026]WEG13613.1 calcium/proton exchanger [Pullulanibacillus sp. KACC 23026]
MDRLFFLLTAIGIPLSIIGNFLHFPALILFIIYCLTIIGLASYIGRATESLAIISGPSIGGLLNATFGNAVELIISFFALQEGLVNVVMASLTGSIIGNLLLVGGLSILFGGFKYKRQQFNIHDAAHNAGIMVFSLIVSFVFPAVFAAKMDVHSIKFLSTVISCIMILIYLFSLVFRLVTHRGVYKMQQDNISVILEEEHPEWGKGRSMLILAVTTVVVALISERLVGTIEPVGEQLGWSELFIGIIIVAIVGNAAEHASAVLMAVKNRIDIAVEISVGSTLQIAMFVAPVLVLISWGFQTFMPLVFPVTELIAMALAAILTISITADGDTNWFEGAMLLAAYVIMGFGFFLL